MGRTLPTCEWWVSISGFDLRLGVTKDPRRLRIRIADASKSKGKQC
jgi:hypothetical protein